MAGIGMGPSKLANPSPLAEDQQQAQVVPAPMAAPKQEAPQASGLDLSFDPMATKPSALDSLLSQIPDLNAQEAPTGDVSSPILHSARAMDLGSIRPVAKSNTLNSLLEQIPDVPSKPMDFDKIAAFSFADTPKEKQALAEKMFGKGATIEHGKADEEWDFQVRDAQGTLHRINPEILSLDTVAKQTRNAIGMGAAAMAEAGVISATGGIGALASAGVIGTSMTTAEELARKQVLGEDYEAPTLGGSAIAGIAGKSALNSAITWAGGKMLKGGMELASEKLAGSLAKFEEKAASGQRAIERVRSTLSNIASETKTLLSAPFFKDVGEGFGATGNKALLLPDEALGNFSPQALVQRAMAEKHDEFPLFQSARGHQMKEGIFKPLINAMGDLSNQVSDIYGKTTSVISDHRMEVGGRIGAIRDTFAEKGKGQNFTMNKMKAVLNDIATKVTGKDASEVASITPKGAQAITNVSNAELNENIANLFNKYRKKLVNPSGVSSNEVNNLNKELTEELDTLYKGRANGLHIYTVAKLKRAAREDFIENATTLFNNEGIETSYKADLKQYSEIVSAKEDLKRVLAKDNLSAESFAKSIFSGQGNLDNMIKLKQALGDQPELWNALKGDYLNKLYNESLLSADASKAGYMEVDIAKFFNKLEKDFGSFNMNESKFKGSALEHFLEGTGIELKHLKSSKEVLTRMQASLMKGQMPESTQMGLARNAIKLMASSIFPMSKVDASVGILNAFSRNGIMQNYIQKEGLEKIVQSLDKNVQPTARLHLQAFMDYQKANANRVGQYLGAEAATSITKKK